MRRNLFLHHFFPSSPCRVPNVGGSPPTSLVIKKSLSTVIFEPSNFPTTIPRGSRHWGDARPKTMTLLHINFPPDAWPLILFASSHPPLPSSSGNRIVTASFHLPLANFPGIHVICMEEGIDREKSVWSCIRTHTRARWLIVNSGNNSAHSSSSLNVPLSLVEKFFPSKIF